MIEFDEVKQHGPKTVIEKPRERAILVGVERPNQEWSLESSLAELGAPCLDSRRGHGCPNLAEARLSQSSYICRKRQGGGKLPALLVHMRPMLLSSMMS